MAPEVAYVKARCVRLQGRYRHCDWTGVVLRGSLEEIPRCPRCNGLTEAIGGTPFHTPNESFSEKCEGQPPGEPSCDEKIAYWNRRWFEACQSLGQLREAIKAAGRHIERAPNSRQSATAMRILEAALALSTTTPVEDDEAYLPLERPEGGPSMSHEDER